MITIKHNRDGKTYVDHGRVLNSAMDHADAHCYAIGYYEPNYPMPAIRECPWCGSKHLGHYHFIYDGLIVPTQTIT